LNVCFDICLFFKGGGWVHSVSFSADGNKLAWVGHDSSISVADATKENAVFNFKTKFLPFLSCIWIAPNTILAAGHGCAPLIFHQGYRDWVVSYLLNYNGLPKAKVFGRSRSFSLLAFGFGRF
jgi:WD40 repeat protein